MSNKNDSSEYLILGSCSFFACRCCHTKYGWEHQKWCENRLSVDVTCNDCLYCSEKLNVCLHPAIKRKGERLYEKINVRFDQDKTLDYIDVVIRSGERDAQVDKLIESLTQRESVRITAMDTDNMQCVIDGRDICFISADGKRVKIVTAHGRYTAKQSLQNIEEVLSSDFLRVSRFEIVNLRMVRKYDFTIGGTLRIEFENGMETWASRRYIPIIKQKLSGEEGYLC